MSLQHSAAYIFQQLGTFIRLCALYKALLFTLLQFVQTYCLTGYTLKYLVHWLGDVLVNAPRELYHIHMRVRTFIVVHALESTRRQIFF